MDTTPDLGVLAPEIPWDYPTPLHTMIEASEEKRKAIQLAKKINAFPEVGAAYFANRPIEDQTCSICKNQYQHLPPLPADKAQYHTNNLIITDRSRIHNNNNLNLNLQQAYDPAICLPCWFCNELGRTKRLARIVQKSGGPCENLSRENAWFW